MDMYPKYKSKFGYQIGNNQIDSYGVDHSGFSLQDELTYQFVREEKENKLLEQLKSRGITQNLPQHTTDFWQADSSASAPPGKPQMISTSYEINKYS